MVAISKTPTTAEFKRDPALYLEQARASSEPLVLEKDNKPDVVLLTHEAYQALLERAEHWENIAAVQKGLLQSERGQVRPAREALEELGRQHGLLR